MKKITILLATCALAFNCFASPAEDLLKACKTGDLEGVKKAIGAGADANALDEAGNPALTYAFFYPDIVKYLLENKADPNLGKTKVLFQAAVFSSPDVMKLVLDAGADPNKASMSDPAATFRTLIAAEKAKGDKANKDLIKAWENAMTVVKPVEIYPLSTMIAANNCLPCMQLLLDKGARLDLGVTDGTLLHTFAASGASRAERKANFEAIKKSIEPFGIKTPDWYVNMPDDRNVEPGEILKVLLGKGLKVDQKNKGTGGMPAQTPLEVALGGGLGSKEAVLLALIVNGADVKVESDWYGPAILQAAQIGYASVLKAMIERGCDINTEGKCFTDAKNAAGIKTFTPLLCAAAKDRLDAVKYLMDNGASIKGISGSVVEGECPAKLSNKSAIYMAIDNKNMEMVKYIAEHKGYDGKQLSITAKKLTNCIGAGSYTPSEYADERDLDDIKSYLKKQGL